MSRPPSSRCIYAARLCLALVLTQIVVVAAAPSTSNTASRRATDRKEQSDTSSSEASTSSSASSRTSKRTGRAIQLCCGYDDTAAPVPADAKNATVVDDVADKFVYLDKQRCNVTCLSDLVTEAYVNRTLFVGWAQYSYKKCIIKK